MKKMIKILNPLSLQQDIKDDPHNDPLGVYTPWLLGNFHVDLFETAEQTVGLEQKQHRQGWNPMEQ